MLKGIYAETAREESKSGVKTHTNYPKQRPGSNLGL